MCERGGMQKGILRQLSHEPAPILADGPDDIIAINAADCMAFVQHMGDIIIQ